MARAAGAPAAFLHAVRALRAHRRNTAPRVTTGVADLDDVLCVKLGALAVVRVADGAPFAALAARFAARGHVVVYVADGGAPSAFGNTANLWTFSWSARGDFTGLERYVTQAAATVVFVDVDEATIPDRMRARLADFLDRLRLLAYWRNVGVVVGLRNVSTSGPRLPHHEIDTFLDLSDDAAGGWSLRVVKSRDAMPAVRACRVAPTEGALQPA